MSKSNLPETASSKTTGSSSKTKSGKDSCEDEIIARIEIADGNCLKQVADFFKHTTSMIPLVFYRDRMEIVRGNHETTIITRAVFDRTEFILDYYTNEALFNDPHYVRTVKKPTGRYAEDGTQEVIEEKVNDPRHVFVPDTESFCCQCKTIVRRDGFIIVIYKLSSQEESKLGSKAGVGESAPDSYMRVARISANMSQEGGAKALSQGTEDYKDYDFDFSEPSLGKFNKKIKLAEISNICTNFVRLHCDVANLMCYPQGFRMKGEENRTDLDFGWGVYNEVRRVGKRRILVNDPNAKFYNFGVPEGFIKALSKLQTIAGNGGVAAVYSHELALQIVLPISVIGRLIITVIPPDGEENLTTED